MGSFNDYAREGCRSLVQQDVKISVSDKILGNVLEPSPFRLADVVGDAVEGRGSLSHQGQCQSGRS